MNPWELIPEGVKPALKAIDNLQLLEHKQWCFRLETHPFPSTNLSNKEIRETVIPAQLCNVMAPLCWVDAGTGRAFRGAFPMTGFVIKHPTHEPLPDHQEWLLEQLREMQDNALGYRRSRKWEVFIAVPLLNEAGQWHELQCYGAYGSVDSVGTISLRSRAERAVCQG